APCCLDACSRVGDGGAGLSGVKRDAHGGASDVEAFRTRHLLEMEGIGWRADQYRDLLAKYRLEALRRALPTARHHQRANTFCPAAGRPETENRTEGKGEKDHICRGHPRRMVDGCPALGPPVPALLSIQHLQWLARRARGLVQPHVIAQGIGKVCTVWGV